jgi:hypothetical protein
MIVPNGFKGYDDLLGELGAQEDEAQKRHLEPNPVAFLKWIRETLREHRQKYDKLQGEHAKLNKAANVATIGLNRLDKVVRFGDRTNLDYLKDMHRSLQHANNGMGYTLDRCKKILDEVTVHYQLVGETLKSVLADKYKKIAMQKELGLRLRDVDEQFERCFMTVAEQKKRHRQLSAGIQKLMHTASIRMPPKAREAMLKEDRIRKIALGQRKRLVKEEEKHQEIKKVKEEKAELGLEGWNFGEGGAQTAKATDSKKTATSTKEKEEKKGFDFRFGIAITLVVAIVGTLVFFSRGS